MKILITGGTGFIGSRLALKCLENGDFVSVLGQVNNAAEDENRRLLETHGAHLNLGSVTDRMSVAKAFEGNGIECVYHLAAAQHEANIPDDRFWEVNVTGTRNLLEAALNAGVTRFVHGSTIGVFGSVGNQVIDEDSPVNPDNIYGVTKLEGEKVVLSFRDKLPVVIVRISETYGPGDGRLLKLFRAIKKNVFFMIGSGTNLHHLIYIDDLIEGLRLAATMEKAIGQIFLLAGKEPITTREMVSVIAAQLGTTVGRFRAPLLPFFVAAIILERILRPLGIQPPLHRRRMDFFKKSFVLSQEKATKILGFSARTGFELGVAETAKWYSEMGYR